jgi:hypothetical protein
MTSSSRTRKRNRRPRGAVKIDSSYIRSRDRSSRRAIVLSFDLRRHNLPLWICQRGLAIDINLARSTIDARGGTLKAFFFSFFSFSSPSSARQHADRPLPRAPEALPSPAAALPERSLARARVTTSGTGINRAVVLCAPMPFTREISIETTLCTRYGNVIEIRSTDKGHDDRQITDNGERVDLSRLAGTYLSSLSSLLLLRQKFRKHTNILAKSDR